MSQNITLLGASYSDVPAVDLPKTGGGSARFIDTTDADATSADIASGKTAYVNNVKVIGSGSGGNNNGYTLRNIIPSQSITTNISVSNYATGNTIDNYLEMIEDGKEYLVTFDGNEYICRCYQSATYDHVLGDYRLVSTSVVNAYLMCPFTIDHITSNGYFLLCCRDTNTHTLKVDELVLLNGPTANLQSKTVTQNGTVEPDSGYDALDQVVVNVQSQAQAKNVQIANGVNRVNTTGYTAVSGQTLTVAETGTYDVYWSGYRSSTSGTSGSQLYIDNTAYGSANTTFSNHGQSVHLSNVSLTKNQVIAVRARARNTSYYMYVSNLTIIQN